MCRVLALLDAHATSLRAPCLCASEVEKTVRLLGGHLLRSEPQLWKVQVASTFSNELWLYLASPTQGDTPVVVTHVELKKLCTVQS